MIQNTNKIEKYRCLHYRLDDSGPSSLERTMSEFNDYVNVYVSKGWQPGGPMVFKDWGVVFQPMVKYE